MSYMSYMSCMSYMGEAGVLSRSASKYVARSGY